MIEHAERTARLFMWAARHPRAIDLLAAWSNLIKEDATGGEKEDEPLLTLVESERQTICRAIEAAGGNKTRAAKILGITRNSLYAKAARHSI